MPPIQSLFNVLSKFLQVARRLADNGYPVTEKKLGADQSWQVWTKDPSGVRIEFHQYTQQSSQRTHQDCILD